MTSIFTRSAVLAAVAVAALGTAASAQTLGEKQSRGQLSDAALAQLISGTGLTQAEARGLTLEDVVAIKWQDD